VFLGLGGLSYLATHFALWALCGFPSEVERHAIRFLRDVITISSVGEEDAAGAKW